MQLQKEKSWLHQIDALIEMFYLCRHWCGIFKSIKWMGKVKSAYKMSMHNRLSFNILLRCNLAFHHDLQVKSTIKNYRNVVLYRLNSSKLINNNIPHVSVVELLKLSNLVVINKTSQFLCNRIWCNLMGYATLYMLFVFAWPYRITF
jgi:hypothetical protein